MGNLRKWREAHSKPILVTEYGADTVAGLHTLPSVSFSEEFQDDFMREYFRAFDDAKAEGWFIGEMVWNFADFMTKQEARRVAGNKKGVFTRLVENRELQLVLSIRLSTMWIPHTYVHGGGLVGVVTLIDETDFTSMKLGNLNI